MIHALLSWLVWPVLSHLSEIGEAFVMLAAVAVWTEQDQG